MPSSPETNPLFSASLQLHERFPAPEVRALMAPPAHFAPVPTASDREAWAALPATYREGFIAAGELQLREAVTRLPASLWLEFARTGNRQNYEQAYFARRRRVCHCLLAECFEGRGRFLDALIDGLWLICEESSWCLPAHIGRQRCGSGLPDWSEPTVDLMAAETAALLAWTLRMLRSSFDAMSPLIAARLETEIQHRVLRPCAERDDFFWMGLQDPAAPLNNWNPWICSNWLDSVLLVEQDVTRRDQSVFKIMRCLDRFIAQQRPDGGCDEGPMYWRRAAASLFDCLESLFQASAGRINVFQEPLVREMGRFYARAHLAGNWMLNFADAPARGTTEGLMVFRFGRRIGDDALAAFGNWQHRRAPAIWAGPVISPGRLLPDLHAVHAASAAPARPLLARDVWLPDLQVMVSRDDEGSTAGFCLAAKGGHNGESHNHNDVGSLVLFLDGEPLLVDIGVETYSAKTFGPARYEIWTMQSQWHNLPSINGHDEAAGRAFAAKEIWRQTTDAHATLRMNLAAAYPAAAHVRRWTRTLVHERHAGIRIDDDYALTHVTQPLVWHFITPGLPVINSPGCVRLTTPQGGTALLRHPVECRADLETVSLTDKQLREVWGAAIHRVSIHGNMEPKATVSFRIER